MEKQISSGLKTTMLIHTILNGFSGLTFLLAPTMWEGLVGWPMGDPAYRLIGATVLGQVAGTALAYREKAWERIRIVVQMQILWLVLGALAVLWGLVFGGFPAIVWGDVVVLVGLAVAFVVFYPRG
jgi:hypothetical protein